MTQLLLVGAGHAHLYVVRHAAELVAAGYRVHLLAPRFFHYSGVASAVAAGDLETEQGRVDVAALADRAGVRFHEGVLASLDRVTRVATTADGAELGYDVLSLNVGSVVAPPGMEVAPDVQRVKPLSSLDGLGERLDALDARETGATVTVVGGGATGLELAAHLAVRRSVAQVRLLEAGPALGTDLPDGAARSAARLLEARGAHLRAGCAVRYLSGDAAHCSDGAVVTHDAAVLASGLSAPPLLERIGLGDERGVPVRATLQHVEHEEVYAVGDCARFLPRALPRVGVHGVKQGPVLHRSLLARRLGRPLPVYRPQSRVLAVLDLGGGTGLATWGRWWFRGPGALWLKRRIDRRWLARYQEA